MNNDFAFNVVRYKKADANGQTDSTDAGSDVATDSNGNKLVPVNMPMKFSGGVTLATGALKNFLVNIPQGLLPAKWASLFPNGLAVPFTGNTSHPNLDIEKAVAQNAGAGLLGGGGKGSNPGDLLKGLLKKKKEDQLGWEFRFLTMMLGIRIAIGGAIFLTLALIDLHRNRSQARRWREYTFLLAVTAIAMAYGAINDQITSAISWEYFYYGKELSLVLGAQTPPDRGAMRWEAAKVGMKATWSVGLILGSASSVFKQCGSVQTTVAVQAADDSRDQFASLCCVLRNRARFFLASAVGSTGVRRISR